MKLAIVGDFNNTFRPHAATNEVIEQFVEATGSSLQYDWISTETIEARYQEIIKDYQGFWIAPGSPYKSMAGALKLIQFARENNIPTIGTCGGFQHMVIEFARNVLGVVDAQHAEYDPYASNLVVNPLTCSLAGQTLEITISDSNSKTFRIYRSQFVYEKYYCNFGLNPQYQQQIHERGFKTVGSDKHQEACILELDNHPFFIATLFVPQDNSTKENPHKLVTAFLNLVAESCGLKYNENEIL